MGPLYIALLGPHFQPIEKRLLVAEMAVLIYSECRIKPKCLSPFVPCNYSVIVGYDKCKYIVILHRDMCDFRSRPTNCKLRERNSMRHSI